MLTKHLLAFNKRVFWLAVLWTCLIFFLSLKAPSGGLKLPFPYADKVVHFTFYFVFVILWLKYLIVIKKDQFKNKVVLVIVAILLGVLIEFMQYFFTTTRQGDIWDALANSIGGIAGIGIASIVFTTERIQQESTF